MNGREILDAIRSDWRPERHVTETSDIYDVMAAYAKFPDGGYRDYFSKRTPASISQLRQAAVAPLSWWGETSDLYALVQSDLHNILPSNSEATSKRSDYPPGTVNSVSFDNGGCKVGTGLISGYETNLWQPADNLKGDIARIYMYMAAAYPQSLWHGRGTMLYADGYYPLLTTYGRNILLDWHRSDPVSEDELLRDRAVFDAQGNSNPFISYPDIAEYIWGRNSDETYPSVPDLPDRPVDPDLPDPPAPEPIMLKAVYSISADGRIDFRSPYVAAGSNWTFDNQTVSGSHLILTDKHIGRHEIAYSNNKSRGKIIITVKP